MTAGIAGTAGSGGRVLVDIDDTIIEVHGHAKQGAGFGYSGVRGLNAMLATVTTDQNAPVIVAQRLRKGSTGSPRGAARIVADALKTVRQLCAGEGRSVLLRADSAFYGRPTIAAALRAGADVSVTVRLTTNVKASESRKPKGLSTSATSSRKASTSARSPWTSTTKSSA